jgi:serine/threonine-protein kinase SRPK3
MSNDRDSEYPLQERNFDNDLYDNEFSDDMSFGGHAPATSHGTFIAGFQDGVEDLEDYQTGGYHPIHLGDHLGPKARYHVLHKLGLGGFSTVWLCSDTQSKGYVAVKVHTADVSSEKLPDLRLIDFDQSAPGVEYINIPRDHFSQEGPNGIHHCLVFVLLGPCVSPNLWITLDNPGRTLRKMCQQTAQGLNFLHQNGLCHGGSYPYFFAIFEMIADSTRLPSC